MIPIMNFECVLGAENSPRIRVRNSPRVKGRNRSQCLERRRRRRHRNSSSSELVILRRRRRRRRRRRCRHRRRHPQNTPTFRVNVLRRVTSSLELAKDEVLHLASGALFCGTEILISVPQKSAPEETSLNEYCAVIL